MLDLNPRKEPLTPYNSVPQFFSVFDRRALPSDSGQRLHRETTLTASHRRTKTIRSASFCRPRGSPDMVWSASTPFARAALRLGSIRGPGRELGSGGRPESLQLRVLSRVAGAASQENDHRKIPLVAQWLGYGGLAPFAAGSLATVGCGIAGVDQSGALVFSQLYGASILSFLGAVHWGVGLSNAFAKSSEPSPRDLIYGVTPSLVAWGASLADPVTGVTVLPGAFGGAFIYDLWRFRGSARDVPAWYMRLRAQLTLGAVTCLGICSIASRPPRTAQPDSGQEPPPVPEVEVDEGEQEAPAQES